MNSWLIVEFCSEEKGNPDSGLFWSIFYNELAYINTEISVIRNFSLSSPICREYEVKYIISVPNEINILSDFSEVLIRTYTKFAEKLVQRFGINLVELAKAYKMGLKNVDEQKASLISKIMSKIKASIGRSIIIVNSNNDYKEYGTSRLIWKNVGLCFTDAKIRRWLKGYTIEFGTTDKYSAGTYLSQVRVASLYTDYIRMVKEKPRAPLIFEHKIDTAMIIGKEWANALTTAINISRKIYKIVSSIIKNTRVLSKNLAKTDHKYLEDLINELSLILTEQELIPKTPEEIYAFLGSVVSYDGSIHGNVLVLNRKLFSIKGLILESLIRAIERSSKGAIKTYRTRKYTMELPIFIGFQAIKYLINEIEHPLKRIKILKLLEKYNGLYQTITKIERSALVTLNKCITGYKLVRWRDIKYPNAHGYKIAILANNDDNCVSALNNVCKQLGLHIDSPPRSKVLRIGGKKALIIALLSIVKEGLPIDLIPNYSSKTYTWRLLDEVKTIMYVLREKLIIEDKLHQKIISEIDKFIG